MVLCTPHPVTDRNQVFAEKRKEQSAHFIKNKKFRQIIKNDY